MPPTEIPKDALIEVCGPNPARTGGLEVLNSVAEYDGADELPAKVEATSVRKQLGVREFAATRRQEETIRQRLNKIEIASVTAERKLFALSAPNGENSPITRTS